MAQFTLQEAFDLAVKHHEAGRLREAEEIYRQILAQQEHIGALHNLGMIAVEVGRHDIAVDLLCRAIALNPNWPEGHVSVGNAHRAGGQLDDAIAAYRQAIALNPNYAQAYNNLGNALTNKGNIDEAIAACRQAISLAPGYADAHNNLGNALAAKGERDQAIAAYQQAIALKPDLAEAHSNLGTSLAGKERRDEAIAAYRQAIALRPNFPAAYNNLGNVLKYTGQLDEAIAAYRQAIALRPNDASTHSNLIFALHYHPGYDARMIAEEHARWNARHAEPLRKFILPHSNDRRPDRRLRIGYVSADFWGHASAYFLIPLLEYHDPRQVELFCYAEVLSPDARTRRLQQRTAQWRSTVGLSDEQVARQIREDRIDILVDLKLHTGNNRLLIFARKPAPVQVTWLGYPGRTGLHTIDYRLSDPYLDPVGMDESIYSEKTIRLPDSFWCHDPLEDRDIAVNALPALENGVITFGCLSTFCKINDQVLALWAQVLQQVQGSRLLLLAHPGSHRERALDCLRQHGIDPRRIEFISPQPHRVYMELYHRIDVGLDTFPYNGHTTSLDSFWMGVPVITLVGKRAVSRAGWCQLSNLGLQELAAQTPEQFVQIAVEPANDLKRLQTLRSTLRQRMEQSPLTDAPRFARNIESAYRQMWHNWCKTQ